MIAAAINRIMMATATKTPATFPGCEKNPLLLLGALCVATTVCTGGAVGVMVKVSTCPVTVITDSTGVGVQVDVEEELVEEVLLVGKVVGSGVSVGDV